MAKQDQGNDCPLLSTHTSNPVFIFRIPHFRKNVEVLGRVQRRVTELVKDLEHSSDEKQLMDLGMFSLGKKKLKGDLTSLYSYLKGGCIARW